MPNDLRTDYLNRTLDELHQRAETKVAPFTYTRPGAEVQTKGVVTLGRGELMRGVVQIVKRNGGENNLHYHTNVETFWWVIKGRVRFYGPGDKLLNELGPNEGIITPRYARYWFECVSDEDLELLQIAASDSPAHKSGRTDVEARRDAMRSAGFGKEIEPGNASKSSMPD